MNGYQIIDLIKDHIAMYQESLDNPEYKGTSYAEIEGIRKATLENLLYMIERKISEDN